jgi:hypothetical protein
MPITAAFAGSDLGPENRRGSRTTDLIAITGSTGVVGDTAVGYRARNVHKNPVALGGSFALINIVHDLGGVTFDIEARTALANRTVHFEVIGDY